MKKTLTIASLFGAALFMTACSTAPVTQNTTPTQTTNTTASIKTTENEAQIIPISHASVVLKWKDAVVYADPTGGEKAYAGQTAPNIVLVTDIHGDHLNPETLQAILGDAKLIVPQAVKDILPQDLAAKSIVLANGQTWDEMGFKITGVPMYNVPEATDSRHTKGRGNGYVIEHDGSRIYVAGDTDNTPEMQALKDIDMAFIPMNPPYTMNVDSAAEAVLAFQPHKVYPYHYRGPEGLNDVNRFKELVNKGNPNIEVILANWYPEAAK